MALFELRESAGDAPTPQARELSEIWTPLDDWAKR